MKSLEDIEKDFDERFTEPDQINGYHLWEWVNGEDLKAFIKEIYAEAFAAGEKAGAERACRQFVEVVENYDKEAQKNGQIYPTKP